MSAAILVQRWREGEMERERWREIEISFYSETWPRLKPGPCTYMHNHWPKATTL